MFSSSRLRKFKNTAISWGVLSRRLFTKGKSSMSVPPEQMDIIRQWVVKAENDHKAFQNLLKMGDDCPFDVVCFLAQQCAEKYLKARLVYLSIDFPKIH